MFFAGMVPMDRARQDWIMSTQRRERCISLAAKIGRVAARLGSRLLPSSDRASRLEIDPCCSRSRSLAADPENRTAPPATPEWKATNSLQSDRRNQRPVFHVPLDMRFGSPPVAHRSAKRALVYGLALHSPAVHSRFHRTLPWAPAAVRRRTERYDGKRDLYFQHAA